MGYPAVRSAFTARLQSLDQLLQSGPPAYGIRPHCPRPSTERVTVTPEVATLPRRFQPGARHSDTRQAAARVLVGGCEVAIEYLHTTGLRKTDLLGKVRKRKAGIMLKCDKNLTLNPRAPNREARWALTRALNGTPRRVAALD